MKDIKEYFYILRNNPGPAADNLLNYYDSELFNYTNGIGCFAGKDSEVFFQMIYHDMRVKKMHIFDTMNNPNNALILPLMFNKNDKDYTNIFPGRVDKTWIWNTINLEMGYELNTESDDHFYHDAYKKWTRRFTLPSLNDNLPLRMIRSADVLLLDLNTIMYPVHLDNTLFRLVNIINLIEEDEQFYVIAINNDIQLLPSF